MAEPRTDVIDEESSAWNAYPIAIRETVRLLLLGRTREGEPAALRVLSARYDGEFGYSAGVDGQADVPASARVVSIACVAKDAEEATVTIDEGPVIRVRPGGNFSVDPEGKLTDAAVVFGNTRSFFVEYVMAAPA